LTRLGVVHWMQCQCGWWIVWLVLQFEPKNLSATTPPHSSVPPIYCLSAYLCSCVLIVIFFAFCCSRVFVCQMLSESGDKKNKTQIKNRSVDPICNMPKKKHGCANPETTTGAGFFWLPTKNTHVKQSHIFCIILIWDHALCLVNQITPEKHTYTHAHRVKFYLSISLSPHIQRLVSFRLLQPCPKKRGSWHRLRHKSPNATNASNSNKKEAQRTTMSKFTSESATTRQTVRCFKKHSRKWYFAWTKRRKGKSS